MATSSSLSDSSPPTSDDFYAAARALGANPDDDPCHFNRDGRRFALTWRGARKNAHPGIELRTDAGPLGHPQATDSSTTRAPAAEMGPFRAAPSTRIPSPAPLTLRLETRLDRAGKSLRINRETQTGDAVFDERVYLESDAPDWAVLGALVDPALRANVVKLLSLGAVSVTLDRAGSLCLSHPMPHADLMGIDKLTPLIEALGAAADAIPPLVPARRATTFAEKLTIAAVVSAIVSIPAFFLCDALWEPVGGGLYAACAIGGSLVWIVALPMLVFVQRGRSDSLRRLVTTALALLLALPLAGTDLVLTLNGLFDSSPPTPYETSVISRRLTSGKRTTYHVTLGAWHPGEANIELTVSSRVYSAVSEGTRVTVTSAKGALGWERLLRITPSTASAPRTSS